MAQMEMEKTKTRGGTTIICCSTTTVLLLGLIAFSASIVSEFKRTKAKDVKLDGNMCSLPGSEAYGLGITASISLLLAQILGTSAVDANFYLSLFKKDNKPFLDDNINHIRRRRRRRRQAVAICLFVLSWMSFGLAILLLGVGTSMNKRQSYGQGWLNRECYVVKKGVFITAAFLALLSIASLLWFVSTAAASTSARALGSVHLVDSGKSDTSSPT